MNNLAQNHFYQPLIWIRPELDSTIKNIRLLLEEYSHDLDNIEPLVKINKELHLLKGSLEILEFFGAALLIEDMGKALNALINDEFKEKDDIFEALLQATLSLEAYVDKLHKDQNDIPLALLPIVNDVRASINEPLLSESALFLPNLSIVPKTPDINEEVQPENQLQDTAKSLRPYYQAALLTWFKDPTDHLSTQQLKLVARNLESASVTPRNRQIWWILGGLYEALIDKGLKSNVAIRLILGQADRVIKTLSQNDEDYFEKNPPTDLLKNALYYISQASSNGKRVETLKRVYQLDQVMPSEKDLSSFRHSLNSPNSETLISIAKELKKNLDQSKAVIDNFARNTPKETDRLESILNPLKHIADTLTILSLSDEKNLLQEQIEKISTIVESGSTPSRETMLSVATALLKLDSYLQNINNTSRKKQDWQQNKSKTNTGDEMSDNTINNFPETEYRLLIIKTATEAKHNISEVKNNILAYLASEKTDKTLLANIPSLLSEIEGCLTISNNEYAASIVNALNQLVLENLLQEPPKNKNLDLDLLAESIVSIEYYLEAIAEERSPLMPILEMTQESLSQLGYPVTSPKPKQKSIPILEAVVTHISEAPTRLKVNANSLPKIEDTIPNLATSTAHDETDDIDEEVVEIFIEEAFEEIADMAAHLQSLKLNPSDEDALSNIRRAYHTLKGSGKIAGANYISEYSAVGEEYISRILCGAIPLTQEGITLLNHSQQFLFELTDCFKKKKPAPEEGDILKNAISELMNTEISSEEDEETETTTLESSNFSVDSHSDIQTKRYSEADLDEVLQSAATQLNIIDGFIKQHSKNNSIATPPDTLHSAINELQNCAERTDILEFIQTTELLTKYINNIFKKNAPINVETIDILNEFCTTTYEILSDLPHLLNIQERDTTPEINEPSTTIEAADQENIESEPEQETEPEISATSLRILDQNYEEEIDLITIFMEEAKELIERGNNILQDYIKDSDNNMLLSATQRLLHTMKGSARMAGVTSVGNLAHVLETLIERIITKESEQPEHLVDLIQATYDATNDIIEDIQSDNDIHTHDELFEQINALGNPPKAPLTAIESAVESIQEVKPEEIEPIGDSTEEVLTEETVDTAPINEIASATIEQTLESQPEKPLDEDNVIADEEISIEEPIVAEIEIDDTKAAVDTTIEEPLEAAKELEIGKEKAQETQTQEQLPVIGENKARAKKKPRKHKNKEIIRIDANDLDNMVNMANEGSATSNRIEDYVRNIKTDLLELDKTISRSLAQMRDLQFESHQSKSTADKSASRDSNDLNIFSEEQKVIQRLMESVGDIENIHSSLTRAMLETDNLVHQQSKIQSELYEQLLNTRMVTFSVQTQRMQRILRQTCKELKKKATLSLQGTDGAIDRTLLQTLMGPMEHIIRNAIAHGIEFPENRRKANKSPHGVVSINFGKEKSEHVIEIKDDGAGMDLDIIRKKAVEQGLIDSTDEISDEDTRNLIFEAGFSTNDEVSQISGRGVGMDVVLNEIQQLGGSVSVDSSTGTGSTIVIRVPFTSSRNHTLFVTVNNNTYALPSTNVIHSFTAGQKDLEEIYTRSTPSINFEDQSYPLWHMDALLNETDTFIPEKHRRAHIILMQHNHKLLALQVDEINETRESVLQPTNPQLSELQGIAGTTVLGDGKVVLIIDVPSMIKLADSKSNKPKKIIFADRVADENQGIKTLIVDDSVTVRKVTERFLGRHGIETDSAKDGVEALEKMQLEKPDIVLLDIEMPNMDGLELAKHIRTNKNLHNTPIIMITSRTGQKHREQASNIGVDVFLGKPYQETELLGYIQALTGKRTRQH